jgi:hypothetical protein
VQKTREKGKYYNVIIVENFGDNFMIVGSKL